MTVTPSSAASDNIDSWIRSPYTDDDYLSTGKQQHPGNGVVADRDVNVTRFSVAKTAHSYDPRGVAAVCGSRVYSATINMRDAYSGHDMDTPRLEPNDGDCA